MLNTITAIGNFVHDIELRKINDGTSVIGFTLACDRDYKDKDGHKPVDYLDCVAWRETAKFIANNFNKGDSICISGRLQMKDKITKDGYKVRSYVINVDNAYFCGRKVSTNQPEKEIE